MLAIFICEDDKAQRTNIETIINKYLMTEELEMELVVSTGNPYDIIDYLNSHESVMGIYFLDIDLKQELNGIELAAFIRGKDIDGKIIFITSHSELRVLTFEYKVEALDYIIKDETDNLNQKIHEVLKLAKEHYQIGEMDKKNRIKLSIGNQIRLFPLEDVMFIETSTVPHKLTLHLTNGTVDFYGKINEMAHLHIALFKTHKSYVVNVNHIKSINKKTRVITMANQETCLLSIRQAKKLEERL